MLVKSEAPRFCIHAARVRLGAFQITLKNELGSRQFFKSKKIAGMSSLLESDTLSEQTTPLRSSTLPCDAYVLAIAAFGSYYAASASAPSHRIFLFDKASLQMSQSFEGHQGGTTSFRAVDSVAAVNKRVIISSGRDGVVRVWDDRTCATAIESASAVPAQNKGPLTGPLMTFPQCHTMENSTLSFPVTCHPMA